jgi:hypothetical protein
MITTNQLLDLGTLAAESYDEYDQASKQLEESFGITYTSAKDNLLRDIRIADQEGLDFSIFQGDDSRFKFPKFNAHIIVRIHKQPTPHDKLVKLADKVAKLEQELKLAKTVLKNTAEELIMKGQCDEVTEKITVAFSRLKK